MGVLLQAFPWLREDEVSRVIRHVGRLLGPDGP